MVHTSCCVCFGKVFCELVKISRELNEIFIGTPSHWLAYFALEKYNTIMAHNKNKSMVSNSSL